MKRLTALFLALALCLSLCTVTAFAETISSLAVTHNVLDYKNPENLGLNSNNGNVSGGVQLQLFDDNEAVFYYDSDLGGWRKVGESGPIEKNQVDFAKVNRVLWYLVLNTDGTFNSEGFTLTVNGTSFEKGDTASLYAGGKDGYKFASDKTLEIYIWQNITTVTIADILGDDFPEVEGTFAEGIIAEGAWVDKNSDKKAFLAIHPVGEVKMLWFTPAYLCVMIDRTVEDKGNGVYEYTDKDDEDGTEYYKLTFYVENEKLSHFKYEAIQQYNSALNGDYYPPTGDDDDVCNLDCETLAKVGMAAVGVVTAVVVTKVVVDKLHAIKTACDAETAIKAVEMPMVAFGDSGDAVMTLQTELNAQGYACGEVDGVFGQNTLNAVIAFQTAKGLTADGVVGAQTWEALL